MFDTSRLLASGQLLQLDGDDLRFRSWEVEDLFRNIYREPLSPESSALLTRRLGGWAAGMQLFHLSVRERSRTEREAGVKELNGRCRLIRSYLTRNVLDGLGAERRDFLMRTSVLGVLSGPLCDALLQQGNSEQVLRDLEREHFFTTSTDGGLTYAYHQVLRNHLEVLLTEELSGHDLDALLHAAGGLLEDAGHVHHSVRAYAHAGDWASVGRVIQQSPSLLSIDRDSVRSRLSNESVPDDPWLALARARRLFHRGSLEASVAAFREVEEQFDDPQARQRCATERAMVTLLLPRSSDRAPPRLDLHRGLAAIRNVTRRGDALIEHRAIASPGEELSYDIGLCLRGDLDLAEQRLPRVALSSPPRSWERLAASLIGAVLQCRDSSDSDPTRPLEEVSLASEVEGYPWLERVAQGVQACVIAALSDERWRLDACRNVIESCRQDGDAWGELVVLIGARIAAGRIGDPAAERDFDDSARQLAVALDAPVLQLWVEALEEAWRAHDDPTGSPARWQHLERTAHHVGIDDLDGIRHVAVKLSQAHANASTGLVPRRREVTVECLAEFAIVTPSGRVDLALLRPRARTLLMALALFHDRDVHRERLTDMLWPGAALPRANRSLQVAVSSVRKVLAAAGLGGDVVQRRGDSYRLHVEGAVLDTTTFEDGVRWNSTLLRSYSASLGMDEAVAALNLYRGELLPEVGYAEWVVLERDRLRQVAAGYAVEVARACLRWNQPGNGIAAARRALELDQYQDCAWVLLAQLHEADGDYSAAAHARARHTEAREHLDLPEISTPRSFAQAASAPQRWVRTPGPDASHGRASGSERTQ
ncbi:MAG: hypothetical protein WA903_05125 [Ornithinimicrobium sp.]